VIELDHERCTLDLGQELPRVEERTFVIAQSHEAFVRLVTTRVPANRLEEWDDRSVLSDELRNFFMRQRFFVGNGERHGDLLWI
jgi:hypothetical protein